MISSVLLAYENLIVLDPLFWSKSKPGVIATPASSKTFTKFKLLSLNLEIST